MPTPDNTPDPQRPSGPGMPGGPSRSSAITTLLVLAIVVYLVYTMGSSFAGRGESPDVLPTNQFVTAVEQGRVADVLYKTSDGSVTGSYWESAADKGDDSKLVEYQSVYVGSDSLAQLMAEHPGVTYRIDTSSGDLLETILG